MANPARKLIDAAQRNRLPELVAALIAPLGFGFAWIGEATGAWNALAGYGVAAVGWGLLWVVAHVAGPRRSRLGPLQRVSSQRLTGLDIWMEASAEPPAPHGIVRRVSDALSDPQWRFVAHMLWSALAAIWLLSLLLSLPIPADFKRWAPISGEMIPAASTILLIPASVLAWAQATCRDLDGAAPLPPFARRVWDAARRRYSRPG